MKLGHLKISFSTRVYLAFLLILGAILLGVGWIAWAVAGDQATTRAEHTLDQSLQNTEFNLEQEASDLSTLGKWLANQNDFVVFVHNHDSIGLARMLEQLTATGIVDLFTVSDSSGQVIVRVRENRPITEGDNILTQVGIKEALSGKSNLGLDQDEFGEVCGRFSLPIYDQPSAPPIGVLVIGFYLDDAFFHRLTIGAADQVMMIYNDRVAVTNVGDGAGESWVGSPMREQVVRAEHEGRPSGIVAFENGSRKYLFKFRPLHFPANVAVGMYGVGLGSEAVEGERVDLFRAAMGWVLLMAIAVGVGAFVLARRLTAPIQELRSVVSNIADGDLSEPVAMTRSDELGEIANQLEKIRERLVALEPSYEAKPIVCGSILLDPRSHRVTISGQPVTLSATEFKLLEYLAMNRDVVVSISQIIENVWGYAADEDDDVVRMAISRLRRKIEKEPTYPRTLQTIAGVGYMLKSKT